MNEDFVWLNGELLPADEARIDPGDRGLLLGDGLFETLLAVDGAAALLERHLRRLAASAELLGIPLSPSHTHIEQAIADLLSAKGLDQGSAALRITLTRGPGPRGLLPPREPHPTLLITAWPHDPTPLQPARLIVASSRVAAGVTIRRHKTLSYLESVLARGEAAAAGADEALLLNTEADIAEASAANIFARIDGALETPPVADGALPGITRCLVLELAGAAGIEAAEVSLDLDRLALADEVFLSNSLSGLRSVCELSRGPDRPTLRWSETTLATRLRQDFEAIVGLA